MHILLSAPIPSHPQNHGNRARLFRMAEQLKARGHVVSFIYCGFEAIAPAIEIEMRAFWDNLIILPPHIPPKKPGKEGHFMLDDWVHPDMDLAVADFLKRWKIDAAIAHYIWASKWLDMLPRSLPRYLDSHDVFGDRHKILAQDGMAASFFYTSIAEEGRGLDRAQKIFAIQDIEARTLAKRTDANVVTLGHNLDLKFTDDVPSAAPDTPLRVGYFASDNPINQHSLQALMHAITQQPVGQAKIKWILMGNICNTPNADAFPGEKVPFVEHPADFYDAVDVVVNPHIGGTGLKIKSVEALAFGKPLVGTHEAMAGLLASHDAHRCADVDTLVAETIKLAENPSDIKNLSSTGRALIKSYSQAVDQSYDRLFGPRQRGEEPADAR